MHKSNINRCNKFIQDCKKKGTTSITHSELVVSFSTNRDLRTSNVAEGHAVAYLKQHGISVLDNDGKAIDFIPSKRKKAEPRPKKAKTSKEKATPPIVNIRSYNDPVLEEFILHKGEYDLVAIYSKNVVRNINAYFNEFKEWGIEFTTQTAYQVKVSDVIKCMREVVASRFTKCFDLDKNIEKQFGDGYLYIFDMRESNRADIRQSTYMKCLRQFDGIHWLYYLVSDFTNIYDD